VIGSLLDVAKSAVRREWKLWMDYGDIPEISRAAAKS
jgi:hypothetical protein